MEVVRVCHALGLGETAYILILKAFLTSVDDALVGRTALAGLVGGLTALDRDVVVVTL